MKIKVSESNKKNIEKVSNEAISQLKIYGNNINLDNLRKYAVIFIGSVYKIVEV